MSRPSRPVPEELRPFITYLWGRTQPDRPDKISASTAAAYQSALVSMYHANGFENPANYVTNLGLSGKPDLAKMSSTAYSAWAQWYHAQPANLGAVSAPSTVEAKREESRPADEDGHELTFTPLPPPPSLVTIPGLQARGKVPHPPIVGKIIAAMKAARFGAERDLTTTTWSCVTDAATAGIPATGPGLCLKIGHSRLFIPCDPEEVAQVSRSAQDCANNFIIS